MCMYSSEIKCSHKKLKEMKNYKKLKVLKKKVNQRGDNPHKDNETITSFYIELLLYLNTCT